MTKIELNFGIIEGDIKRFLEEYFDSNLFKQRKSYDEYYVNSQPVMYPADLGILHIWAERVSVEVGTDCVILSEY